MVPQVQSDLRSRPATSTSRRGDKWHLDEVFAINGYRQHLWRPSDQEGNVLDILVIVRRDARSANRFFRKLSKGLRYVPRVTVTDKLRSYGAAHREATGAPHAPSARSAASAPTWSAPQLWHQQ
jgi:transposase-like protein